MSEIYHYGIKGQRWGVRNYQNPDGTLTSAGKERYQKEFYKDAKKHFLDMLLELVKTTLLAKK